MRQLITIIFLMVFSASGCVTNQPSKTVTQLNDQVKLYGKLIRWRGYEQAASMIKKRSGTPEPLDRDLLKEIRVTKYEVLQIKVNEDQDEAVVVATISYYHERVNAVNTIEDVQVWWHDEEAGAWFLDGDLPRF